MTGDPGSDASADAIVPPACDLTKPFGTPTMVANVSTSEYETGARLSTDEKTIWFSRRPSQTSGGNVIFVGTRPDTSSGFTGITKVTEFNGGSADGYLTTTSSDLLGYFISLRTGNGDIYRTSRGDAGSPWGALAVVTAVSTTSLDDDVFVLVDGRALYFDSNRAGGSTSVCTERRST